MSSDPFASNTDSLQGLSDAEVASSRERHGSNAIKVEQRGLLHAIWEVAREPMPLLLVVAASIYFITGHNGDGIFMLSAIAAVIGISLFQESRSRNAIKALAAMTQPLNKVIRNGKQISIDRDDIVVGDYIVVEEGTAIGADAELIRANDFTVDESILTGEFVPVVKQVGSDNQIFQGTLVTSGLAIARVAAVGAQTSLGRIGSQTKEVKREQTPLQQQIEGFVKKMAWAGAVIFIAVWVLNYIETRDVMASLLRALTLAMSILPEEIPVAFTTFMALGAWRLMGQGVIVKRISTVETLGSASVICLDKTGTITENQMALAKVYSDTTDTLYAAGDTGSEEVIETAMWASEPMPFDPMEIALHNSYKSSTTKDLRPAFRLIHEFPLGGTPPMMTHAFSDGERTIIAAKGAPEALLSVSSIDNQHRERIVKQITALTEMGYRVLGVGESKLEGNMFPATQQELVFTFKGLVAFQDPVKRGIQSVFNAFYKAGIDIKIITGDNAMTARTISKEAGLKNSTMSMSGEQIKNLNDDELRLSVEKVGVFARMFPEGKLRIITALKELGHIVAMTGDGVNDAPALKASHISIAMGKRGSALAKEVSSLVLTDDNLSRMVDAIAMGRKIYSNLKKAIRYIISIHIPIILTVFIPLVLGWLYPNIFTPVHVIFLELVMGPTCSIVYENEPMESNAMQQPPRRYTSTFLSGKELAVSIVQGLAITIATLSIYQFAVHLDLSESLVRTLVFITLISANVWLSLVNRSFYYSFIETLRYKNPLMPVVIVVTILMVTALLTVPTLIDFFQFERPDWTHTVVAMIAGFISVVWYEIVKVIQRVRTPHVRPGNI
ncbi:MAG: cation-translocating P-type ATPase [Chryseolinea sp.]